ncbi:glutathione S-transferase [Morchella snyderi]|nr:glutathione S-transferase [Morchella snyderi]
MAAPTKQFTLYSCTAGPNPWKVTIILEELHLSYHPIYVDMPAGMPPPPFRFPTITNTPTQAPFLAINPNGRMPALIDHSNNDFTIWESGAIVLYLIRKYDSAAHTISFPDLDTDSTATQWLMFQMSAGQGPYFGQYVHFAHNHGEKLASAVARYRAEIDRILGVLEGVLVGAAEGGEGEAWLVGGRCSYADLAFVPWHWVLDHFVELRGWREGFPAVAGWQERMAGRAAVRGARETRAGVMVGR